MNQSVGTYTNLLLGGNFNVKELDYGCGPSSAPVAITNRCEVNEDDQDCENMVTMKVMKMEMFKLMDMFRLS